MQLNILFPVLNEHLRLERGIDRCMAYMKEYVHIPYQLTILDNGSTDGTKEIITSYAKKHSTIIPILLSGPASKGENLKILFDIIYIIFVKITII